MVLLPAQIQFLLMGLIVQEICRTIFLLLSTRVLLTVQAFSILIHSGIATGLHALPLLQGKLLQQWGLSLIRAIVIHGMLRGFITKPCATLVFLLQQWLLILIPTRLFIQPAT